MQHNSFGIIIVNNKLFFISDCTPEIWCQCLSVASEVSEYMMVYSADTLQEDPYYPAEIVKSCITKIANYLSEKTECNEVCTKYAYVCPFTTTCFVAKDESGQHTYLSSFFVTYFLYYF